MKQEYKDLVTKYLKDKDGIKLISTPAGWSGSKIMLGKNRISINDRVYNLLNGDKIEDVLIYKIVRQSIPYNHTSYNLEYNAENQEFRGTLKTPNTQKWTIDIPIDVPDNVWFDSINVFINIKSKNRVSCTLSPVIRNGFESKELGTAIQALQSRISALIMSKIKEEKGWISGSCRTTLNYSKEMFIHVDTTVLTHNKKEITIKL